MLFAIRVDLSRHLGLVILQVSRWRDPQNPKNYGFLERALFDI